MQMASDHYVPALGQNEQNSTLSVSFICLVFPHPFPAEDHGLRLGSADPLSHCFTFSRSNTSCRSLPHEASRTTWPAKRRDEILRSPTQKPPTIWLRLCPESVTEGSPDGLCSLWTKSNNRTHLHFRSGRPFLPITPLQVLLSLPTWALKSPSRKMDSLHVAPLSTLHHWLQEGWVLWAVTWQIIADNSQDLFPKLKAQGNTPLTHWQTFQCTEQIKDCPPCSLPLTEGNSRLEQRRSSLQETGSQAQASSGSFPFREVIFHVPKATLDSRKSVCQGRFFGLRLGTSRTLRMGPW